MATLLVRNVDGKIVKTLQFRAGMKGFGAETVHRKILADAVLNPRRRSFAGVLQSILSVGHDDDLSP